MGATLVHVAFAAHVAEDSMNSMVSALLAAGNTSRGPGNRSFVVEVYRQSRLPWLRTQLKAWEQYGWLRWEESGEHPG